MDSFATGMDWLLERTVELCPIGMSFGQTTFTNLDFADDVSLFAELLELLTPALETMASEAAALGLEVKLVEDQGSSPGLQGAHARNHYSARPRSRGVCLPRLPYPLNNPKHPGVRVTKHLRMISRSFYDNDRTYDNVDL